MVICFDDPTEVQLLVTIIDEYRESLELMYHRIFSPVRLPAPPVLDDYFATLLRLRNALLETIVASKYGPYEIHDRYSAALRHSVIWARLRLARKVESRRALTIHPDMLAKLDAELKPYDRLLASTWFQNAKVERAPQLTDFLPVQLAEEQLAREAGDPRQREYDEKFHILQAPSLFLYDLDRARQAAGLRDVFVAVAFIDIDHFRTFNKEHGNTFVDRQVLPRFMRCVEAHAYQRGYAYRYGGDEYCVLLPNVIEDEALASMERLRASIAALTYEGTAMRTTVSIGVVIVRPDSYYTGSEIESFAEAAKAYAKDIGRNRVATYVGPQPRSGELRIASPTTSPAESG
jgi:diguanylate cyclase (GGDEF)-like protein